MFKLQSHLDQKIYSTIVLKKLLILNMTVALLLMHNIKIIGQLRKNILTRLTNFKDRKKPRQLKKPILRE